MKELLIKSNCLIVEALEALDKTAMKCLLVVDDKNKLIGSLTDGDIRRAILKGINFNEPIDKAYFRSPKALTANNYSKKELNEDLASENKYSDDKLHLEMQEDACNYQRNSD